MAAELTENTSILFNDICKLFEKISANIREKKTATLKKYIYYFRQHHAKSSFHSVLRLLLPHLDRDRGPYGVKEHNLAKTYIRILCMPKDGKDALKLLNFRVPRKAGSGAGDFADVAFWVVRSRCSEEGGKLTVSQVNQHLDSIADKHAAHNPRGVDEELVEMIHQMSALEQKWLLRILLKDMKLGISHNRIFNCFHPDAREFFDVNNSLNKVCRVLNDAGTRLHEIEVKVFEPLRPMLSERCDVQQVEAYLAREGGTHYVEPKHDGERFQLHLSDGQFRYFSRNGYDYTESYGSNASNGFYTPQLAKQLSSNLQSCILDGEMMGWNTKLKCFGSKGMNFDVKTLRVGTVHQPCFCVFDILYYNGQILTNRALVERIAILESVFTSKEGIVVLTSRQEVTTGAQVMAALNQSIDNRGEGIVVKTPSSVYKPNSRKGGWYKIKPEYTDGLMVELDLLIIGGYYGEGWRRGLISHFLLGVAVPPTTTGDPTIFESIGRVGSGCSREELAELGQRLAEHWQRTKAGESPPGILWTKEKPDLWIQPDKSIILQVKATEVVQSNAFKTGYTLRFPRVEQIRYDKPWHGCLTTSEFTDIRKAASGKLYSMHATQGAPVAKKRARLPRNTPSLGEQFRSHDLSRVDRVADTFCGKELCVIAGSRALSKKDIERKIAEQGGAVVQNPGSGTFCVVAEDGNNLRVRNILQLGEHDVATMQWLLDCLDTNKLKPWVPDDLIGCSHRTEIEMARHYDKYGDSFSRPATLDSLRTTVAHVKKQGDMRPMTQNEVAAFDAVLFNGVSPYSIFRLCTAYLDRYETVGDSKTKANTLFDLPFYDFSFAGGKVEEQITEETTHVILHKNHLCHLEEIKGLRLALQNNFILVHLEWISDSWNSRQRLDESMYSVK